MLEELLALAMLDDRRRRLESVIVVARSLREAPGSSRPSLHKRLRHWLQPGEWAAIVPREVRTEAEAWRVR